MFTKYRKIKDSIVQLVTAIKNRILQPRKPLKTLFDNSILCYLAIGLVPQRHS